MIIDTSNALAAPGSSRGYACLSVACRSIAPGGASGLLGVRGWGLPRRARRGPPSPQAQTRRRPPSPSAAPAPFPLPARSLRGHASVGGGEGGPGREDRQGTAAPPPAKREREERAGSGRVPVAAAAAARVPPSGVLPRAARGSGCGVRGPGPGGRSRAAVVARRRRWGRVLWGRGKVRSEAGVLRGEEGVGGACPGRRGSPPAPGGGPASGRPPLPPPLLPAAAPHHHRPVLLARPPARHASRVRGRKPAPRPPRPRSWPRSRGLRAPGGDPRDAAVSSAVARPPPARGRAVPRRGPVPSFRVGAGRAPPPPPAAASPGSSPTSTGRDGSGAWVVAVAAGGVCPAPGACPSPPPVVPASPAGRQGGRRRPRLSLARLLPSPGPSPDGASGREGGLARVFRPPARPPPPVCASRPPRRDLRSDVATR